VQLEKDQTALLHESGQDNFEEAQDDATQWLLERDLSDPVENLFTVDDVAIDDTLTEFEAEIAGRPMFRGHGEGDDLSAMLEEEIVVGEVGGESDIYANAELVEQSVPEREAPMTIEHANVHSEAESAAAASVVDGADILSLDDDDEMGEHFLVLVKSKQEPEQAPEPEPEPEPEAIQTLEPNLDIEFDLDSELDLGAGLELDEELNLDEALDLGAELDLDEEFDFDFDVELNLEPVEDLEVEAGNSTDVAPGPVQSVESVIDYVANTPAPVDENAFDQYLLVGQQLAQGDSEPDAFEVERTEGVVNVDPVVESNIDYHEDFHMIEGFNGDTVSAITCVIAQVMEELNASVEQRLKELDVAPELIHVDVMLGNDVESIIECVTDGYAPIVEIRPDLPLALRQLGQTEVDALYVRISHEEIGGNWNTLFRGDFAIPGSAVEAAPVEGPQEPAPQPFAALDLDEFSFDESGAAQTEDFSDQNFGADLALYSEHSGDDPLSAIDFGAVVDADISWCIPDDIRFSESSAEGSELFVDFLDVFMEEAAKELEKLEDAVGSWEGGVENNIPAAVSHTLHTLKGIAKGVGLQSFGTLVHNYETLLDGMPSLSADGDRAGYFRIVNAWLDAVVRGFDTVESTRGDIDNVLPVANVPAIESRVAELEPVALEPAAVSAPVAKEIPRPQSDKQLADEGAKTLASQQSIRMTAEALDNLLNLTNQAQQLGVRSSESTVRSKLAAAESLARLSSVRAHIVKIADRALINVTSRDSRSGSAMDALEMDQYSELQEAANILSESVEDLEDLIRVSSRQVAMAEALMKQQAAVISSLGSSIQAVRVVPVSRLIPGLRRIVRTVGADLGKTVSFKVLNQVGTLDRDNHARCQVILEHMVRNAMDHGIETPEQRKAQDKPAAGCISIDVRKKGADYIITLSDDGRGIDPDLMRETAYNKGLDVDVDALSDEEATRLIFHKGFTTAGTVSEISGRGVGMDIVLNELQQIGGDIEIESTVGRGTSFHIRIPPNVSVNGALLVSTGERSYAIPLDGLIAVDYVDVDSFFGAVSQESTLDLFGVECEPAYLGTICHGENLPEASTWAKNVPVLIAGSQDRYMAIAVDDVKQALELVIRSLGVQFSAVPGVAGATTTADGQAVVALDLNALVKSVGYEELSSLKVEQPVSEQMLVLVVDDSRTQRMVSTSQFDTLGVETITAENGMVAIDLLNTTHRLPDIILLDVEMPVKDGIQTLREIRKSSRYSHIPVIMVTSRTGAKHRALADEAGCNGYMGKPFNFPVLVDQINELTGHKLQIS
jgi:chemosensory pili system protein ChpA (sensor histidine kinase/response regulator)